MQINFSNKFVFFVILFTSITLVKGQSIIANTSIKDTTSGPEIFFENTEHDFDTLTQGTKAMWDFTFKNKGNEALKLEQIRTSCVCTVSKWSKKKIMPGKTGVIKVKFSAKYIGNFYKTIAIISNSKTNPDELQITGTVVN